MESTEELQQNELTALKSIYAEDFIETPPTKAWKGVASLPEFSIRVPHLDSQKICFNLHVIFPKSYPTRANPTFTIQKPISGLNNDQVAKLSHAIQTEVRAHTGSEMVMEIVTFCQEWMNDNLTLTVEAPGSLALQMNQRAEDEEKARKLKAVEEAQQELERANRLAQELDEQIRLDAAKQRLAKEKQYMARRRANSAATEVPMSGDTPTESFAEEIEFNGVHFNTVKFFHPRNDCLGVLYAADPICDDVNVSLPLELHVVTFDTPYYSTSQGRKKLKQVENEIQRLTLIKHENVVRILAVKLNLPNSNAPSQLTILCEQSPALTLQDVLEDCDSLREERASDYLAQILSGLNAIHARDIVHRGITPRSIGLSSRDSPAFSKLIKLFKVAYKTRLLDLHKSNPFRVNIVINNDEPQIPDAWLSKDVKNESSLLYTRHRDIHSVGIVFMQMLLGLDVTQRYSDIHTAFKSTTISSSLQHHALNMLLPPKKSHVSCLSLLAELSENSVNGRARSGSTVTLTGDLRTPMAPNFVSSSPEIDYFRPMGLRHTSRWKEDWEELELLGKGAFGSVVKARNKIDGRIYAVKKVHLRTQQSDMKIFREVNALSRLSHRFIVRYYTTWVETSEPSSTAASDDEDSDWGTVGGLTSVPNSNSNSRSRSRTTSADEGFIFSLDDLDDREASKRSFPSIHFTRSSSSSPTSETSEEDTDSDGDALATSKVFTTPTITQQSIPRSLQRTLYIQMEFVEQQTLKERVDEGITEDEAWRLFQQIVDALVHMSTLGILHRDIKLTNIFIDGNGDCKVGDFGLATSSLAAVEPSDVTLRAIAPQADMTLEVGTRLYIAPEVQSRKKKPTDHSKADMYSLGIVFFEMNYRFFTSSERIAVIENLRKPDIQFPQGWDPSLTRQREIITWLLQHEPDARPSALELSQSPLLPPRLEDEYFRGALRMMTKPDSPHVQTVLSALFNHPPKPVRGYLYDQEAELPDHAPLNVVVRERLVAIFRLHGAVDMEPPLLLPLSSTTEEKTHASFIDRHGEVVVLPNNLIVPFARLAARESSQRIKRYHLSNIYRPYAVPGHPKVWKAGIFDIITPDVTHGPIAAGAEVLAVAHDILENFPNLVPTYELHVSHSSIIALALARIPAAQQSTVLDIIQQPKSSSPQKKALLLKKGLLRSVVDELEVLSEADEDIDGVMSRLEKVNPSLVEQMRPAIEEMKATIQHAASAGVSKPIIFRPLMLGTYFTHFKDGVLVEVAKRSRRTDVIAAGGRYDNLISQFAQPKTKTTQPTFAFGLQIDVEKLVISLAVFQSTSVQSLIKEARSFGFWSPRRCDVYVISYQPGYLSERLEVAAWLWKHNISADLLYESGLSDVLQENHLDMCAREGILFTVYPRPRAGRADLTVFKVKSILKGTEYEVSRQDLIPWLQHEIAEQQRVDLSTSSAPASMASGFVGVSQTTRAPLASGGLASDVQLYLPQDAKKQRRQVKQLFLDRAYALSSEIKSTFLGATGMPVMAIDVSPSLFEILTRGTAWITDEDAWKGVVGEFISVGYAQQVREAIARKKSEGCGWLLIVAVKEERVGLVNLKNT